MASALIMGIFGAVLTHWLGAHYFAMSATDTLAAVGASNIAGFVSLLLTLAIERRKSVSRYFMKHAVGAWLVLFVLYTSILCGLDPALREIRPLATLFVPLVFATGFMLPIWGPTQDWMIRLEHRLKQRSSTRGAANNQFSRPHKNAMKDAIRVQSR